MIVSFHPIFEADVNLLCAGRQPDDKDLAAVRQADAVILPQGCPEPLYRMAREACPQVFPNYDVRFQYPGKTGQAGLFQEFNTPCPQTWIFDNLRAFERSGHSAVDAGFPLVLKLDWGGEGETVFRLSGRSDLNEALSAVAAYERTGQTGFILQSFVHGAQRSLRVVVIGEILKAYWRIQTESMDFGTSVAKGAIIDSDSDPVLREKGISIVRDFCGRTGINLAGFDLLFDANGPTDPQPLFLEINYFFGRSGIGGSKTFYALLQTQIDRWLNSLGLSLQKHAGEEE